MIVVGDISVELLAPLVKIIISSSVFIESASCFLVELG